MISFDSKRCARARLILICSIAFLQCISVVRAIEKPVKVFVLAGQSNREGKTTNTLSNHQATDAKTKVWFQENFFQLGKRARNNGN